MLPLRSAVHCCRCEALELTEREQAHKKEDDHCGHPHTEKNQLDISHLAERLPGQPAWPVRVGKLAGLESWPGRCDEAVAGREPSAQRTAASAEALELTAHR